MRNSFRRDTPEQLHQMLGHVPSMLAYWDRNLRCRYANLAYKRWFGADPSVLVGTTIAELLGPELFALNEPYIRAALNGQEQVFERVVPGPDGIRRHSLATYVPDIVDGQVMGFIAHVTDVTLLKETEAALRAEVAQREAAIEQLRESELALKEAQRLGGIGSWEWDVASDTTTWSDELCRIFGRDRHLPPPTFAEHPTLYSAESWGRLRSAVASTLQTGEPYDLELEYVRVDGKSGWLTARGEAVHGPTGAITRLRGTVQEASLRHAMEEARVRARSAELANHNKTQLLSRVSHELRTPLNAILGFSHLLQRDETLGPKARHRVSVIGSSSRHMLSMVEEILDISAAEAGRIQVECVDVDVVPIIQNCRLQASAAATAANITLGCALSDSAPVWVLGDAKRVKQVVDNLVSNGIKYTPAGGAVQVTLTEHAACIEIAVRDTGGGLTEAQVERAFQPFERLGAETSNIPGSGLGLALSKVLVELMCGSIRVESEPGRGSTFTVSLPKATARA